MLGDRPGANTNGFVEAQPLKPPPGLSAEAGEDAKYRWTVKNAFDYAGLQAAP